MAILKLRELLLGALRQGPVPEHVAFVMDGNRRFARSHGIETVEGHNLGFEALARILEVCYKSGVRVVSVYAFSIENFKRSKFEVDALMEMAKVKFSQLAQHGDLLDRYGARICVLGRLDLLRPDVLAAVNRAVELTSRNGDRVLNICCPYTSRDEITSAVRSTVTEYSKPLDQTKASSTSRTPFSESHIALNVRAQNLNAQADGMDSDTGATQESLAPEVSSPKHRSSFSSSATLNNDGQLGEDLPGAKATETQNAIFISPETITSKTLTDHMFTKGNPPLDILIRTSGVERLSDFMLWQCHENTDIVFLDVMWPEFDIWHFLPVLLKWQRRISKLKKNPDGEGDFDGDVLKDIYEGADGSLRTNGKIKDL